MFPGPFRTLPMRPWAVSNAAKVPQGHFGHSLGAPRPFQPLLRHSQAMLGAPGSFQMLPRHP